MRLTDEMKINLLTYIFVFLHRPLFIFYFCQIILYTVTVYSIFT